MKTIEESILSTMDCTDYEILPYLPYILQDFWEMGSNPDTMVNLIKKHQTNTINIKVLDLGCGKGAVSVNVAKQLHCECYGIDAIPEFINTCVSKADEHGVANLCTFDVGDIREKVKSIGIFDVIILGAIGQVFGNYFETLTLLKNNLKETGIIIIDDGYIEHGCAFKHIHILSKTELKNQITDAGMQLIDEVVASEDDSVAATYDTEHANLWKRCQELSTKYPAKAELFLNYINQQRIEYDNLKNEITCSTMVVKRSM